MTCRKCSTALLSLSVRSRPWPRISYIVYLYVCYIPMSYSFCSFSKMRLKISKDVALELCAVQFCSLNIDLIILD